MAGPRAWSCAASWPYPTLVTTLWRNDDELAVADYSWGSDANVQLWTPLALQVDSDEVFLRVVPFRNGHLCVTRPRPSRDRGPCNAFVEQLGAVTAQVDLGPDVIAFAPSASGMLWLGHSEYASYGPPRPGRGIIEGRNEALETVWRATDVDFGLPVDERVSLLDLDERMAALVTEPELAIVSWDPVTGIPVDALQLRLPFSIYQESHSLHLAQAQDGSWVVVRTMRQGVDAYFIDNEGGGPRVVQRFRDAAMGAHKPWNITGSAGCLLFAHQDEIMRIEI